MKLDADNPQTARPLNITLNITRGTAMRIVAALQTSSQGLMMIAAIATEESKRKEFAEEAAALATVSSTIRKRFDL